MAEIGKATLTVVPKLKGLDEAVKNAFASVQGVEGAGERTGRSFASGMARTGVIAGAVSAVSSKIIESVQGSIGAAINRFDTLNNYPKVMEALGYTSKEANQSIGEMQERLLKLPTTLDSMVSLVQGLTPITGNLDRATKAGLALNDMLVASGSNQQLVNAAQEQFRQILSKGKPEMQDWRSLVTAAPGQVDQLAKSMLGASANANDLYKALGGGLKPGEEAKLSMDQLLDAIIRLDTEGGQNFKSFQEQAETAAGGISTSMANTGNAIVRGVTGIMDVIGKENIAGVFDDLKGTINSIFKTVQGGVAGAMPTIKSAYEIFKQLAPTIIAGGAAYTGFSIAGNKAMGFLDGWNERVAAASEKATKAGGKLGGFGKVVAGLGGPFAIANIGIGLLAAGATFVAGEMEKSRKHTEDMQKSTTGLSDAVKRASQLDDYRGKVKAVGEAASVSALSVDDLITSTAKMSDAINERSETAEKQIAILNSAETIIDNSIGKTDLSTEAQGQLKWALQQVNEQFGLNISAQDVINNKYTDQNGNVVELKENLEKLIEAKKEEARVDALTQTYSDLSGKKIEATKTVAAEYDKVDWDEVNKKKARRDSFDTTTEIGYYAYQTLDGEIERMTKGYDEAKSVLDGVNASLAETERQLGREAAQTQESTDAWDAWSKKMNGSVLQALMDVGGRGGFENLVTRMRDLGVNTEELSKHEGDYEKIFKGFNGSTLSLIECLQGLDGVLSDKAKETYQSATAINDNLKKIGAENVLDEFNVSMDDFSVSLSNAGIKAEDLKDISKENFDAMVKACDGDIKKIISLIFLYNKEPILDKDFNIDGNQIQLIDALGNIYTWNGSSLVTQSGEAVMNEVQLVDALGNIVTWNGSSLVQLIGTASVDYSTIQPAIDAIGRYNRTNIDTKWAHINFVQTTKTDTDGNVHIKGTAKLTKANNARGGYRPHADGGIVFRETPLDVVGEDGAEAIVPLSNQRFAQPFIDMLSKGINEKSNPSTQLLERIADGIASLRTDISQLRLEMDGNAVGKVITPYANEKLGALKARESRGL